MYTLLLALIYLAYISLGLPDSLLGSGWPAMYPALQTSVTNMGIVSMVISGGTILSSLASDAMTRRLSTRAVTVISVFLTAVALFGFSISTRFWMLIVFAVPYGLGAGAIDAALNNYVALHYASRHMSWLHCFWGVGTIVSPFVMSYGLTHAGWEQGYRIIAFLQLGIGILLLATVRVWKIHDRAEETTSESIGLRKALKITGVPVLLVGFFAYCAAEATTMYWASTYLVQVRGVSAEQAARFASLFYIGITVGRFLCGFITNRFGDRKMIVMGTCVLLCGVALLAVPVQTAALVGFVVIGFGCAPIYPCVIHSTPDNFGAENSGAIIGIQMAAAYVGTTFIPPLFGLLGKLIDFRILPIYLAAFFGLMLLMLELTFRKTAKRK